MTATRDDAYPQPPAGYRPARPFRYPKLKLQVAAIAVLVITMPPLLFLTWLLQGQPAQAAFAARIDVNSTLDWGLVLLTLLTITPAHELVHGLAYRLLGYRVSYGVSLHLFAAYAAAFGQWQTRAHNIIVALAPLAVFTLTLVPLLLIPHHAVVLVTLTALLMNLGGAVGDLYLTWRLLRLPRGTLLYDVDVKTMLIYLPAQT